MTLVLIPPLGVPAGALAPLLSPLSRSHEVALHELPGQGLAPPSREASLQALARGVAATVDAAGVEQADVCGFGFGGIVALRLAIDQPERIRRLVVVCGSASPGNPDAYRARAQAVRDSGLGPIAAPTVGVWVTPATLERNPQLGRRLAAMLTSSDAEAYARHCELLADVDLTGEVGGIVAPTLILAAAQDRGLPPEHSQRLVEAIPAATLHEVQGAAHLPWLEQLDAVADAINAHLAVASTVGEPRGLTAGS
jgi:3-oxoadipate enol-lactonase